MSFCRNNLHRGHELRQAARKEINRVRIVSTIAGIEIYELDSICRKTSFHPVGMRIDVRSSRYYVCVEI